MTFLGLYFCVLWKPRSFIFFVLNLLQFNVANGA